MKLTKDRLDVWEQRALAPPPDDHIDTWAERTLVFPRGVTETPGPLSFDRIPFAREILRNAKDPEVEEITLCFSAQSGKTVICQTILLYYLGEDPWPCLHVMAREEDAQSINVERYQEIISASPPLRRLLDGEAIIRAGKRQHNKSMKRDSIRMNGTSLNFASANSPAALASRAICKLCLDETDKYPEFSGKEADPVALARERTTTFMMRLILKASTPTTKRGYIWSEYEAGDRRRYWVPCPHCGAYQRLIMGDGTPGQPGISLRDPDERDPERIIDAQLAFYRCENGCEIEDSLKPRMLAAGKWVPHTQEIDASGVISGDPPSKRRISYHLSRLYAPWANTTWSHVIAEFFRSKSSRRALMNFRNSWLAEPWEDSVEELTAPEIRAKKRAYFQASVPPPAHCLTAGVDVQSDHFWYVIRAWGQFGRSWLVRCGRSETWTHLNALMNQASYRAAGTDDVVPLKIVCVDAGFAGRADEVYEHCLRWRWQAVRGASRPSRLFQLSKHVQPNGTVIGLALLDTDTLKSALHRRIRTSDEDPHAWQLPEDTPEEYFDHLTAEQLTLERDKTTGKYRRKWRVVADGRANHLFDCEVYALAGAQMLDLENIYLQPPDRPGATDLEPVTGPKSEKADAAETKPIPAKKKEIPVKAKRSRKRRVIANVQGVLR